LQKLSSTSGELFKSAIIFRRRDIQNTMDHTEIASLFQDINMNKESTYRKVEYIQVSDQQAGTYSAGQFSFNLEPQKSHFSVLADSYLVIPLQITNATVASKYAIKNSLLSLIQGVQITSSSGTSIVNEQQGSTPILANLRLMIDASLDFMDCNELHYFGRDQNIEADVSGAGQSVVGGVNCRTTSAAPTIDPLRNPALGSRISVFTGISTKVPVGGAGVYLQNFMVYLPLRFIHSWFACMDFPITNAPFILTFNVAGTSNYKYCPFTCPTFASHLSVGTVGAPAAPSATVAGAGAVLPQLTILPSGVETGYTSGVRLYLKVVQFHDKDAVLVRKRIESGYRKTLVFTTSDYRLISQPAVGAASVTLSSTLIGSSFVRPSRVWVLPVLKNTTQTETNSFPSVISTQGQYLTNTNVLINGLQFYQSNLRSQYEFYKLLREQMIGGGASTAWGSPITYVDFLKGINPYCFDISRNPTVDSNTQVSLTFSTDINVPSGTIPDLDLIFIIERLNTYVMDVSAGGVTMTVAQGAHL
jgi:hypothetical protein